MAINKLNGHERNILLGQTTANLYLDGSDRETYPTPGEMSRLNSVSNAGNLSKGVSSINMLNQSMLSNQQIPQNSYDNPYQHQFAPTLNNLHDRANILKDLKAKRTDEVMNELKTYLTLMDQYSLHNFIIYNGHTLRDTPEFVQYRETYIHSWGSISYIITQLEQFVSKYNIKMAVIDGPKVYKLSQLNLAYYDKNDLLTCIANSEQMKPSLSAAFTDAGISQLNISVIKIQSLIRRFIARRRYYNLRKRWFSIIKIQAHYRRMKYRRLMMKLAKSNQGMHDDMWEANKQRLRSWWQAVPEFADEKYNPSPINDISKDLTMNIAGGVPFQSSSQSCDSKPIESRRISISKMIPIRQRLIIFIPSISSPEYIRLSMIDNIQACQNMYISCLYQLMDPDIHMIYVSPIKITLADIAYHETFMALLGIPTVPKRLHFIVPELIGRLPMHISLAQLLLCSTAALNKVKFFMRRVPNAMIVPTNVSWAEKRLADYLNIPMLSPEPLTAVTIQSKSFIKKHFIDGSVNIPIGAHDIYSLEDFIIGLSRLISTNLGIKRWIFRLNYDFNNESIVYLDVDKLSVVKSLRKEQAKVLSESNNNLQAWYSRPVQFRLVYCYTLHIILSLVRDMLQSCCRDS